MVNSKLFYLLLVVFLSIACTTPSVESVSTSTARLTPPLSTTPSPASITVTPKAGLSATAEKTVQTPTAISAANTPRPTPTETLSPPPTATLPPPPTGELYFFFAVAPFPNGLHGEGVGRTFHKVDFDANGIGRRTVTQVITGTYIVNISRLSPDQSHLAIRMGYDGREGRRFEYYPRISELVSGNYILNLETGGWQEWMPDERTVGMVWDIESRSIFYSIQNKRS